jgi:rhomboid domain-containing protein 1
MHRRGFHPGGLNNRQLRMLLPLAVAVWQQVQRLDFVPYATLATLALNVYIYLHTAEFSVLPYCLSAAKVLAGRSFHVLLTNTFVHASDSHIYYNALSFLHKGVQLERQAGAGGLAALLLQCCALTPLYYVALELAGSGLAPQLFSRSACAVGFSGVIFALKVVCQHRFPAPGTVMGVPLPPQLLAWGELVLISVVSPQASFVGHLAGILAGLTLVHGEALLGRALGGLAAAARGRRVVGGRL